MPTLCGLLYLPDEFTPYHFKMSAFIHDITCSEACFSDMNVAHPAFSLVVIVNVVYVLLSSAFNLCLQISSGVS